MTVVTDEPLTVGDLTPKVIEGSVNAGHEDFTGPYDVGTRSGRASAIQDAIDFAENQSPEFPLVLVPDALGPGVSGYDASSVNFSGSGGTWTGRMVRAGQQSDVYDVKAYGAASSGTGAQNSAAIQAAIDAAVSAGGGVVSIRGAGTYEINSVSAPAFSSNPQAGLVVQGSGITLLIGPGVTLQWADDQINDTDGKADLILVESAVAGTFTLVVLGQLQGNTSGQTNWTGGYGQIGNTAVRSETQSAAGGSKGTEFRVPRCHIEDFFSNPLLIRDFDRVRVGEFYGADCGEGPQIGRSTDVQAGKIIFDDDADVAVGDGSEFASCDVVQVGQIKLSASNGGSGSGVDPIDTRVVQIDELYVDNWSGVGNNTTTAGESLSVGLMVMQNIGSSQPILVSGGSWHYEIDTLVVLDSDRVTTLGGAATDPESHIGTFIYREIDGGGGSALQVEGNRTWQIGGVDIVAPSQRCLILRENSDGDSPEVHIGSGRMVDAGLDCVRLVGTGGGSTFAPTAVLSGVDLSNPGGEMFNAATSDASLANVKVVNPPNNIADADRPSELAEGSRFYNSTDENLNIRTSSDWILPDGTSAT